MEKVHDTERSKSHFRRFSYGSPTQRNVPRSAKGRNSRGIITARHRGGGHKRLYRKIDFRAPMLFKGAYYAMNIIDLIAKSMSS